MKKNGKTKFYLALVIFSLVGQIAWVIENMYFNVFIYEMFNASPSDISAMVSASLPSVPQWSCHSVGFSGERKEMK